MVLRDQVPNQHVFLLTIWLMDTQVLTVAYYRGRVMQDFVHQLYYKSFCLVWGLAKAQNPTASYPRSGAMDFGGRWVVVCIVSLLSFRLRAILNPEMCWRALEVDLPTGELRVPSFMNDLCGPSIELHSPYWGVWRSLGRSLRTCVLSERSGQS